MPPRALEYALFAAYLLLGPTVWAFYAVAMFQSRKRMQLLRSASDVVPDPPPAVTILIPAKDESERIGACLEAALAQDYPNFNVVAVDDRSTDGTGTILDELAAADARLKVIHLREAVPPGWTGKNRALHVASQSADGDWLLFVDADVLLEPNALSATLAASAARRLDLFSLIPKIESHTLWEGLLIPLCSAAAGAAFTIALANNAKLTNTAFANGQFMLFRRSAYEQVGGHVAVRDKFCEDMVIARLLKQAGLRPRIAWGTELIQVRMYDTFGKIVRGWSRIFFAAPVGRPWPSLAVIAGLLLCCFSIYPAVGWGLYRIVHHMEAFRGYGWLAAAAVHAGLMLTQVGIMYRWMRNPMRYALAFPLTSLVLVWILLRAVWMCVTKKVEWRGTSYSHTMDERLPHAEEGAIAEVRAHSAK